MVTRVSDKVSYEEVAALCDAAVARGEPVPSVRNLLAAIGRGSTTTILKHRQRWNNERGPSRMMESVVFPAAIQRAVLDEINRQVAEARAQLEIELADTQDSVQVVIAENETLSGELEVALANIQRMQDQLSQQAGQIAQLHADLTAAVEREQREREGAEKARQDLARAELRLESLPKLEGELNELRTAFSTEREARAKAEQAAAVAVSERTGAAERAADLEKRERVVADRLADCEKRSREMANELANARVEVQARETKLDGANREIEDLRRQLGDARETERRALNEAGELRGQMKSKG